MDINMREIEAKDAEAIKALVEYTWKQENIDRISAEIMKYIEKIADEVKQSVEKRTINDAIGAVEVRLNSEIRTEIKDRLTNEIKIEISKVVSEIKEDVENRISEEIKRDIENKIIRKQRNVRLFLVLALSITSIGVGIAIAALAGLIH